MDDTFEDPMLRGLEAELAAPFPPDRVSWRVGQTNVKRVRRETGDNNAAPTKGVALAYIDARDVYDRLDAVLGISGWQCEHHDAGDGRLSCRIGIRLEGEWVWKSDGAGARQADQGLSEQDANKGDFSDALKRAAVAWGIGRYLYELDAPWVALDKYRRIEKDEYNSLRTMLLQASGPAGAQTPSENKQMQLILQTIRTFCTDRASCEDFYRRNQGIIAGLTKANKERIEGELARIANQEKTA